MSSPAPPPQASARTAGGQGSLPLFLILGGVVALVALLILLGRGDRLEKSAIGFDGLAVLLRQNGVDTLKLLPAPKEGELGTTLRILPVYDADISAAETESLPDEEKKLGDLTLRPLDIDRLSAKLLEAPTLVVLPKWRGGFPAGGAAHPDLLIPPGRIWFYGNPVARAPKRGFGTYPVAGASGSPAIGTVTVYSLQVLDKDFVESGCYPILDVPEVGTILASCYSSGDDVFFALSDPDLLDNHGLALGDNASVAPKLVAAAGTGPVFIDYDTGFEGTQGATEADAGRDRDADERTLADLSRFFAYPFSYVWAGMVVLTGLALWRGSRRFGKAVPESGADSSKRRTIAAAGRILRLTGSDRDLVNAHVRARMEGLSAALLRPRKGSGDEEAEALQIERIIARRSPDLSRRFAEARRGVTAAMPSERARFDALELFERTLQEIWHEFGRASGPSRQHRR